jgi:predicted membrane protein
MVLQEICPPALIYFAFSATQVIIDTMKGMHNVALVKLVTTLIFTVLLNFLCRQGLGIISWFIVFIPFILMTIVVSLILLMLGLDPTTGKKRIIVKKPKHKTHPRKFNPKSSKTKHNHHKKSKHLDHPHEIKK